MVELERGRGEAAFVLPEVAAELHIVQIRALTVTPNDAPAKPPPVPTGCLFHVDRYVCFDDFAMFPRPVRGAFEQRVLNGQSHRQSKHCSCPGGHSVPGGSLRIFDTAQNLFCFSRGVLVWLVRWDCVPVAPSNLRIQKKFINFC